MTDRTIGTKVHTLASPPKIRLRCRYRKRLGYDLAQPAQKPQLRSRKLRLIIGYLDAVASNDARCRPCRRSLQRRSALLPAGGAGKAAKAYYATALHALQTQGRGAPGRDMTIWTNAGVHQERLVNALE